MAPRILRIETETTLLAYLLEQLADQKRGDIKRLLKHGAITVNGLAVTQHDKPLAPGDEVAIDRGTSKASPAPGLDNVYEDEALILINTPVGLLSVATPGEMTRTAHHVLNEYIQKREKTRGRVFVVHRLDRETSGLLLFARTTEIRQTLQDNWGNVEKRYYAVVEGLIRRASGTIKSRLGQDETNLQVRSVRNSDEGKDAITHFRVVKLARRRTLLDIELETGRRNQIRVHLSEMNHPIVGDPRYGKKTGPGGRLALHAYKLAFDHPVTGERMTFETPLPTAFERMLTNA
ncbi:MAG: RluA family pseudouridine synthase [FCB group bacterium]|jgi:23S rRNA pseudouridine1911/1915/1917 synthase|nr:RluA family pseudouridine synthase [FCB group bacterium]